MKSQHNHSTLIMTRMLD